MRHQRASCSWIASSRRTWPWRAASTYACDARPRSPACRGRRRRRRCSGGRARPTASGRTASGGPRERGGTRAAGSRDRCRRSRTSRAAASGRATTASLPVGGAIEADAARVGAVVVDRRPVGAPASLRPPTARARSGGPPPSGGAGRAASCSRRTPRASASIIAVTGATKRCVVGEGHAAIHSSAIVAAPSGGSQASRPKAYQLACAKCVAAPVAVDAGVGDAGDAGDGALPVAMTVPSMTCATVDPGPSA